MRLLTQGHLGLLPEPEKACYSSPRGGKGTLGGLGGKLGFQQFLLGLQLQGSQSWVNSPGTPRLPHRGTPTALPSGGSAEPGLLATRADM